MGPYLPRDLEQIDMGAKPSKSARDTGRVGFTLLERADVIAGSHFQASQHLCSDHYRRLALYRADVALLALMQVPPSHSIHPLNATGSLFFRG
jgi:hypothetical protein